MAPMARSVVDLAIVLDATAGVDPADPTTVPVQASYLDAVDPNGLAGKRIGVRHFRLQTDLDALMRVALNDMAANGAEIVEVPMPREPDVGPIFSEFFTAFDEYLAARPNAPIRTLQELVDLNTEDPQWQEMLQGELGVSASDLAARERALEGRAAFRDEVVALMDELDLDAIFYPASNQTSPLLAGSPHPYDCASAGYGGFPAISIPAGFAANGLPVGFELMGRPFAEETLISLAAGYEAHTNHRVPPPETPPL
jgi:amidase